MSDKSQKERGPLGVSVVVPVFNEEENLDEVHARLTEALTQYGHPYEILFVDDGSRDRSFRKMRELFEHDPNVRVVQLQRNFGQQMATAAGLQQARGEAVVLIDADLQTRPEEIPLMLDKLSEGYDIVYGVRIERKDPLIRRLGSWFMSRILHRLTGINMPDNASGFIALDRRFVDSINRYTELSKSYSGLFAYLGYGRYASLPVQHYARHAGASKYNLRALVHIAADFICSFSTTPLKLALAASIPLAVIAIFGFAVLLAASAAGASAVVLAALWLSALMLLCTSVLAVFMGVLGVYVARIYKEVQGRPPYVIREILERPNQLAAEGLPEEEQSDKQHAEPAQSGS
jgi:glycosyltransferase involved in cell wall biosynthesis